MTLWRYAAPSAGKAYKGKEEMIKLIIFSALLNTGEIHATLPDDTKIEARRRGKGNKKRRRGGSGLR